MKPIIFSPPMVQKILDSKKTQTRRIMKPQPDLSEMRWTGERWGKYLGYPIGHDIPICPYGKPGDNLWVRETFTWVTLAENEFDERNKHHKRHPDGYPVCMLYKTDIEHPTSYTPSIFMPKWACRLFLGITNTRIEKLQQIGGSDAWAEGEFTVQQFFDYWDKLNLKRGFGVDTNPWVWVIDFEINE